MSDLSHQEVGISSVDAASGQRYTTFLREQHLMDLAAEGLRSMKGQGLSADALGLPEGGSDARRMVAAVEHFLAWLDGSRAGEAPSQALGALQQQALLAFLDRYTQEPRELLAIARTLAAQVAALPPRAAGPSVSALAHDLRSPLNALSGALHVLQANPGAESGARMLAIAQRNTERLADMIDAWASGGRTP